MVKPDIANWDSRFRRRNKLLREEREPKRDGACFVLRARDVQVLVVDAEGGRGAGAGEPVDGDPGED